MISASVLLHQDGDFYTPLQLTLTSECRNSGQNVKAWCRENGVCEQTYYKWQRRLFEMAQVQREVQFAEVTPVQPAHYGNVAVTVRIAGAEADIHSGADAATVETVLRILKSC